MNLKHIMLKEARHKRPYLYDDTYKKYTEKANLDTESRLVDALHKERIWNALQWKVTA